jgi:hypothetical protein
MKFIKRTLIAFTILLLLAFLFRGFLYRNLVMYKSLGHRPNYSATDKTLTNFIDAHAVKNTDTNIKQIIKLALSITSNQLNFTATKNDNDPNKLISSKTAHCVGYAAFFATTCNYLLKKYKLDDAWHAKPQIGQLYLLGTNVHKYFNSSFFKDHDFVRIENKLTGEKFAVDPSVHDYFDIDFVTYGK